MKLSLIILAFYVAVLSCFPCQDVPAREPHDIGRDAGAAHDDSQHKDQAGDFCSPFCICSCCASVSMPPMVFGFVLPSPLPDSPEKSFEYKTSFNQTSANLIWQPPRLV
jgi:hypothetical protein